VALGDDLHRCCEVKASALERGAEDLLIDSGNYRPSSPEPGDALSVNVYAGNTEPGLGRGAREREAYVTLPDYGHASCSVEDAAPKICGCTHESSLLGMAVRDV
jgi:hypothetical protein